jgi:hypothetical protein
VPPVRTIGEQLRELGFTGEHLLLKTERADSLSGKIESSFFLASGSLKGEFGQVSKLRFYWCSKPNEVVCSSFSLDKFVFVIDDSKEVPTVEFLYCGGLDVRNQVPKYWKLNLNKVLEENPLGVIRVRISKSGMEKEIYLPK